MRLTPRLLEAKPTEDWRIWLRFEDGLCADVDFSHVLDYGGVFLPLRDREYFRTVAIYLERDAIFWPNGVDIAPEALYLRTQEAASARV